MKFVKMSLVAAMVMGASAFAVDNIKVSGDVKLYYGTNDIGQNSLFEKGDTFTAVDTGAGSYADTALRLGITGDLLKGISFGLAGNAISTLGLEKNLVSNTWSGAHGVRLGGDGTVTEKNVNDAQVDDATWMSELWIAATMGKTTAKIGRMMLDTPLAFSETWAVAANAFDAAVLINQDLPDTTLVGAWVGKGNGINPLGDNTPAVGIDGVVGTGAEFGTFVKKGAYVAAAVNNSWKPLTVQAWYYNVVSVADAFWLQADMNCVLIPGIKWGAQYADISGKNGLTDSSAYALKAGYEGIENLKLQLSYSNADKDGTLKIANVATNNLEAAQSKLYTEAWWNNGYVGAAGAKSISAMAEYDVKDLAKFGAYYTTVNGQAYDTDATAAVVMKEKDIDEITLSAAKTFGPLDVALAYVFTDAADQNNGDSYNSVIANLTLNF